METSSTGYTHQYVHGQLVYCSVAIPWDPQTEYGECSHLIDESGWPEIVFTDSMRLGDGKLINVDGEMRGL